MIVELLKKCKRKYHLETDKIQSGIRRCNKGGNQARNRALCSLKVDNLKLIHKNSNLQIFPMS